MSIAAPSLAELEDKSAALVSMFEPQEYGLARPTGGQAALLRSMLPGTAVAPVCHDYTQFMLARDLAAGSPFCGPEVGDPTGLLLGLSLDGGTGTPVLFDPAFGPRANASPSLAAVGRLGSGKSFFLKRLCWDTVARGGQVVTIDRTRSGEYVRFAVDGGGRRPGRAAGGGGGRLPRPDAQLRRGRALDRVAGVPVAPGRLLPAQRRGGRPRRGGRHARRPAWGHPRRRRGRARAHGRQPGAARPRGPRRWCAAWRTTGDRPPGSSPSARAARSPSMPTSSSSGRPTWPCPTGRCWRASTAAA